MDGVFLKSPLKGSFGGCKEHQFLVPAYELAYQIKKA